VHICSADLVLVFVGSASNKGRCLITPEDGGVPNVRGSPRVQPKEVPCTENAPNLMVLSHAITWPILD
jgi:hypothetical protein